MVYGCDICQDVCPWNRGVEKRRAGRAAPPGADADRLARRLARARPGRAPRRLRPPLRAAERRPLPAPERARRARQLGRAGAPAAARALRGRRRRAAARARGLGARAARPAAARDPRPSTSAASASRSPSSGCSRCPWRCCTWRPRSSRRATGRGRWRVRGARGRRGGAPRARAPRARRRRAQRAGRCGASRSTRSSSAALLFVYSFVDGQPTWSLLFVPTLEAALRFGLVGGVVTPVVTAPLLVAAEVWRAEHFEPDEFRAGPVGVRVARRGRARRRSSASSPARFAAPPTREATRARESEAMRDELGRRLDLLEAANRCARALASSLRPDEAFDAFARELRGVVPADRMLVLRPRTTRRAWWRAVGSARDRLPAGQPAPDPGHDLRARPRRTHALPPRPERTPSTRRRRSCSRSACARVSWCRSRSARARSASSPSSGASPLRSRAEEIELVLAARPARSRAACRTSAPTRSSAATAEELRRLSTLRADFVSMVSHELRSPIAAVVGGRAHAGANAGGAVTEQRRALPRRSSPARRSGSRSLVADVLDTSRLEAGTLGYSFDEVDVGELVHDAVDAAAAGPGRGAGRGRVPTARCRPSAATATACGRCSRTSSTTPSSTPPPGGEVHVSGRHARRRRHGRRHRRRPRHRARASTS